MYLPVSDSVGEQRKGSICSPVIAVMHRTMLQRHGDGRMAPLPLPIAACHLAQNQNEGPLGTQLMHFPNPVDYSYRVTFAYLSLTHVQAVSGVLR